MKWFSAEAYLKKRLIIMYTMVMCGLLMWALLCNCIEAEAEVLVSATDVNGWRYDYQLMDNGEAAFVGADYYGAAAFVGDSFTIPKSIEGHKVTRVGYVDSEASISIYVNSSVVITKVTVPDSVTVIGAGVFGYHDYTDIILSSSVETIEKEAFNACDQLVNITLPEGLKTIGEGAFSGCNKISEIVLPSGLKYIGKEAFSNCNALKSITIPSSIEYIGDSAFSWCGELISFDSDEYSGDPKVVFWGQDVINACEKLTNITIPDGVEELKDLGSGLDKVSTIKLPDSLKTVRNGTFYSLKNITELVMPPNVELIERDSFYSSLKTISFFDSKYMVNVDRELFDEYLYGPSGDTSVYEPGYLFWQGDIRIKDGNIMFADTFVKCNVENGVINLPNYEFTGYCNSDGKILYKVNRICLGESNYTNVTAVNISSSIVDIAGKSFADMPNLTTFTVDSENINFKVVDGGLYNKYNDLIKWPCKCNSYVELKNNAVNAIGAYSFAGCTNLKTLIIPIYVSSGIPSAGASGVYVGDYAFRGCSNLTTVQGDLNVNAYNSYNKEYIFDGVPLNKLTLIIPQGSSITEYATTYGISYKPYMSVKEINSENHLLELVSYNGVDADVVIPSTVTYVPSDYSSSTASGTIVSIGVNAFNGNTTAQTISIADTISSIEEKAFVGCTALQEFSISNSIYGMSSYTNTGTYYSIYRGMLCNRELTTILAYPSGRAGEQELDGYMNSPYMGYTNTSTITSIGAYAISGCVNTDYLYVSSNITDIHEHAFSDNGNMTLIVDAGSAIETFAKNNNMKYILADDAYNTMPHCRFESLDDGTAALTTIYLPESSSSFSIHIPSYYEGKMVTQIKYGNSSYNDMLFYYSGMYGGSSSGIAVELEIPSTVSYISEDIDLNNPYGELSISVNSGNPYYKVSDYTLLDNSGKNLIYTGKRATNYSIPEGVEKVYKYAFNRELQYNTRQLGIPSTLNDLTNVSFSGFSYLSKINVDERNQTYSSEDGILFSKDKKTLIYYPQYESASSYTIPDSVEVIASGAFSITMYYGGMDSLSILTIPSSVREVGNGAFSGSRISSITIEAGLEELPDAIFSNCSSLTTVVLPSTLKRIGNRAFYYCSSLKTIQIPDNVTEIGDYAFNYCNALKTVTMGSKVETIGSNAFSDCSSITSIKLSKTVKSIGKSAFYYCSKITDIDLGEGLTELGSNAFERCSSLRTITIPDSLTVINSYTFRYCSKLTKVELGSGVQSIGNYAFYYCSALESITIPGNIKTLNDYIFSSCSALATVNCEEGLEKIGSNIFSGCSSLATVILPESVTTIKSGNFKNNTKVILYVIKDSPAHTYAETNSITYVIMDNGSDNKDYTYDDNGDGTIIITGYNGEATVVEVPNIIKGKVVTGIGKKAFYGKASITKVSVPSSVRTIGDQAMSGCSELVEVELNDRIVTIGASAFSGCEKLEGIVLPSSLSTIESKLFEGCKNMTEITFGGKETQIGADAFSGCEKLTAVSIPETVTKIGNGAINGCSSLQSITINRKAATSTYITRSIITDCTALKAINTAEGSTILESKNGVLYNKSTNELLWYPEALEGDYEIPDGTVEIGSKAFLNCKKVGTVTVPTTVTEIASDAFLGCGDNFVLNLLEGNTAYVSQDGILYNDKMTIIEGITGNVSGDIVIPDTVKSLKSGVFEGQTGITSVTIPGSITTIPLNAFAGCTGLTTVIINDGVETISTYAFGGCESLSDVTIPESVESIAKNSFDDCGYNLTLHVQYGSVAWEYARSRKYNYELPVVAITGLTLEQHTLSMTVKSTTVLFVEEKLPVDATEKEQWISSDESVVAVNKSGVLTAKSIGTVTISVCNGDGTVKDSCEVTVVEGSAVDYSEVLITGLSFEDEYVGMTLGDATIVDPIITPSSATEKVIWSSSDSSIASVNSNGIIRAIGEGIATITASAKTEGVEASFDVYVKGMYDESVLISSISFSKDKEVLKVGNTTILDTVVEPEYATEAPKWKSSNTDVCEVDPNTGIIRAKKEGKAIITAYGSADDVAAECEIEVKRYDSSISDIILSREEIDFLPGDGELLTATITPENADENVKWSSSDVSIVKVSPIGYVTAVSVGEATITVSNQSGSISKTCKVKVWEKMLPFTEGYVDVEGIKDFFYDTTTKKQTGIVVKYSGKELSEGKEYNIKYSDDCINAGTVTMTITGEGLYSGEIKKTYSILPHTVLWADGEDDLMRKVGDTKLTFAGAKQYTIPGTAQPVSLQPGTDYQTDIKTLDCKKAGIYEVTYTFMGNYAGTHVRKVTVYPKTSLKSLKSKKKTAVLKWTKWDDVSGYYVMRATKKNGTYSIISNIKKSKTVTYKDKKVKRKKTYYYKIVPYKMINGEAYKAEEVNVKKIKIK